MRGVTAGSDSTNARTSQSTPRRERQVVGILAQAPITRKRTISSELKPAWLTIGATALRRQR
jgi:hypothetical protein